MARKQFKGDVGIGTLIVFIAMVLVAAVAASVLLNVSGVLQQKASATGKETTKQVSSNLIVVSIVGTADLSLNTIDNLTVTIRATAGSGRIDLKNMLITIDNNEIIRRLIYNNSCSSLNNDSSSVGYCYNMTDKIDPNNVFTAGNPVIDPNSIVEIDIKNLTWNLNLSPRSTLRINLMPEIGTAIFYELKTPEVYSGYVIPLYP